MTKISDFFTKYLALIVCIVALCALIFPKSALWISTQWINYLLMVIMFLMGLTMKFNDFTLIFQKPKDIILGIIAQYSIMPLIAFMLCKMFNLDEALTAGVILVGTCPGGTASNVITYFSKGDIALSICMTSTNTLLAPFLTPLITYLLLSTTVKVDLKAMFFGIISVVIIPIILGCVINKYFSKMTQKFKSILPALSVIVICLIIASVISHNSEKILSSGLLILSVVILHNFFGYLFGFILGKIFKMPTEKIKAFSIEIGMQNSGLATSLAATSFPTLLSATVPGAIFSVWHNISGAILANIYKKWDGK